MLNSQIVYGDRIAFFIANTVQGKLPMFEALAFQKENIYIRVNFIMDTFKINMIWGPNFAP